MAKTTLKQLSEITRTELVGDPSYTIENVAAIDEASPLDISFISSPRYEEHLVRSSAGAVIVSKQMTLPEGGQYLLSDDPSAAFQLAIEFFKEKEAPSAFTGRHPTATIHETATIAQDVTIGPHAVLDAGVTVGKGSFVGAGVYLGPRVKVGENCTLYPNVVVREGCSIGHRVVLQPNAVIGSCGFGYATDAKGEHTKLAQLGNVVIEDDVEIGANTTVDRARFGSTRIGKGTKIDNQVQIAHNVEIGENNILVAQAGIAGSVKTGKRCIFAAQAGCAGHIELGDDVILAATAKTSRSILEPGAYGGAPAIPAKDFRRNVIASMKLHEHLSKLRERVSKLEATREPSS